MQFCWHVKNWSAIILWGECLTWIHLFIYLLSIVSKDRVVQKDNPANVPPTDSTYNTPTQYKNNYDTQQNTYQKRMWQGLHRIS